MLASSNRPPAAAAWLAVLWVVLSPAHAADEIVITGQRERPLVIDLEPTASASRVDLAALKRAQAGDVFDAVRDMPGVSIEGGPRTSGKSFSIRGFSSNEDVMVQIDGVTQNFEKYRYGSGVDIDPELLKTITVYRGGAATTQGSGYIGGVVQMETKDASDMLEPDERYGFQAKAGYQTNNDGALYSATGYGRPLDFLETLFNVTKRHTNEFELPDGTRFQDSAEGQLSGLGKLVLRTDEIRVSAVQRYGEDSGLEPFDITGGVSGVGGNVRRSTTEKATSLRLQWDPASTLLNIDSTLGFIDKNVTDEGSAIAGVDADGQPIGTDFFDYQIWTLNTGNTWAFDIFGVHQILQTGVQGNRERREAVRQNLQGIGFNPSQPSGEKESHAIYAEHTVEWHGARATGGIRRDWITVAPGHDTRALLTARGLDETIGFARNSPSFGLNYGYAPLDVFYRWSKTFRAPLLDEYFARGTFSSCFEFSAFTRNPVPPSLNLPQAPVSPDINDFADIFAYLAALTQYNSVDLPAYLAALTTTIDNFNVAFSAYQTAQAAFLNDPAGEHNAFCGEAYEPERAITREAGFALTFADVLAADDSLLLKLTYYDIRVSKLLESIYENAITHEISQPGNEVRKGFEVELHYAEERWFADFALTTLGGYFQYNFFADNIDASVAALGNPGTTPLFNQPANSLSFTFGVRPGWNVELGHRLRAIDTRAVTVGIIPNCPGGLFTNPVCNIIGRQSGYITSNFFAAWQPAPALDLRLTIDNALNKQFELAGFGGALGATAPGRDVRLSVSYRF